MRKVIIPILMAVFSALPVNAAMTSGESVLVPENGLDLSRSFEGQRAAILRALADGETYKEIAAEDAQVVRTSLERISGLLGGATHVEALPEASRVEVFNEQERINSLLTKAHADSRVVCRREKPTGSNRPTNTCLTVAQRRRARDAAEDFIRYNPRAQERPASR